VGSTRPPRGHHCARMHLELLEDRCVLSSLPPSVQDQVFLELLNEARANPAAYGASIGVDLSGVAPSQPLAWDPELIDAAQAHSQDMNDNNYFSHTSPGGEDPGDRITAAGYDWTSWGESIAAGYTTPAEALAALITDAGVPDLGHREQLLAMTPVYQTQTQVGIGIVQNGSGTYSDYYTIDTAQPAGNDNPFITGVVFNDANNNGQYDAGEGLGGITVTVQGVGSTTTYATGGYQIQVAPGTYSVTFSGAGLTAPVTESVTVGNQNQLVNVTQNSAEAIETTDNQFVQNLWQDYLKRSPSAAELAAYSAQLQSGQQNQASLTQMVQSSPEYATVCTNWLHETYQELLGRPISSAENTAWLNWLQQSPGATLDAVAQDILASPEYTQREWSGWIQSAYETYLHRSAAPSEVTRWENCFQGGMTEETFLGYVMDSPEYQSQFTTNSQFVTSLYTNLLGRQPAATEVSGWLTLLQEGATRGAIVAAFVASDENQWRQDVLVTGQIYQNWLGRAASSSELNSWATDLLDGLPLETLETTVLDSQEYFARAAANAP
jgi:hypothetical protein